MQIVLSKGDSKIVLKLQKSEGKVLFCSLDKTAAYRIFATSHKLAYRIFATSWKVLVS